MNGITVSATSITACKNSGSFGLFFATASTKALILGDIILNFIYVVKTFSFGGANIHFIKIPTYFFY
ncbi:hypothetical protein GCM10023230_06510 [Flavobacterium hankyongi]|uniref:Uncharacterized protein n=1 Tax=Flavobacterium hankyongi TaxID=1176532 RepID=A0ABP8ZMU9_9FLAO